jgi:HNH endonuclease
MSDRPLADAGVRRRSAPGRPRRVLPAVLPAETQRRELIRQRFATRIRVDDPAGCWIWSGTRQTADGYGGIRIAGTVWLAHRLSWTLSRGPIPEGLSVLHRCDTPPCIRPEHLFLGTQADNMLDARNKREGIVGQGHQQLGRRVRLEEKVAKTGPKSSKDRI